MRLRSALTPLTRSRVLGRVVGDVAATVTTLGTLVVPDGVYATIRFTPIAVTLMVVAILAMLLRHRMPRTAVAVTVAVLLVAFATDGNLPAHYVTILVSLFTLGRITDRRTTLAVVVIVIVVIWTASVIILGPVTADIRAALLLIASVGFAAAAGDASRSRRAYIEEMTERARHAEETAEAEARRRVADERVAIARDLHDLMAHQIAVVSLNAGVASRALRDRPEDAERALGTIYDAAQTVLGEISGLLTVLRTGDGEAGTEPITLSPSPGLRELPDLVRQFESSGLTIERRIEGERRDLPDAADAVAYRVLHEALTNALKHGGDDHRRPSALVQVDYLSDSVELTVTNPFAAPGVVRPGGARGGHGLDGVRERVASVRGRVEAGPGPGPIYRLTAWLPIPTSSTGRSLS